MKRMTVQQWAEKIAAKYPAGKDVDFRFDPKLKDEGDVAEHKKRYVIRISTRRPRWYQKEVIVHEWAHIMAGWRDDGDSHTDKWGIWYARIWRHMSK